ncbi:hypothetical protein CCACVL1_08665 [Corchorus capsularis]|uniref:Importin N-terminal domain-containing protein n=1 Tax=Corchorus capsularis TaxID=210143 RepID=A0A1R3IZA0_COCAP|nr:hypothetical protein CCACVL1_08665 [Corchorus capsularis]
MAKAVVYTLLTTAFIYLFVFSPNKPHGHHGPSARRLGLKAAHFDPLVTRIERTAEQKGGSYQGDHPQHISYVPEVSDAYEYFNDDGSLNTTLRLVILFPMLDNAPPDNLISPNELAVWIDKQARDRLGHRTDKSMSWHDKNGDGVISFTEYLPQFTQDDIERNNMEHGEAGWWMEQFKNADRDLSGTLDFNEFKDLLHPEDSDNENVQTWLLREKTKRMDEDHDGKLNFKEFLDHAYNIYKSYADFETASAPVPTAEEKFVELDINQNKYLEMEELKPILRYIHPGERLYAKYYTNYLINEVKNIRAMEVTQVLLNAQSIDGALRTNAEENLKQFQEQNLPSFLLSLSGELANEEKPVETRKLAGLILKNALDAKEQHRKFELVQRWLSLDANAKSQIKACLLKILSSPVSDARSTASQVVAKVAGIELPQKQWPELIGSLLSNIHQLPAHAKQATLETLGYLCEEVSPDVIDQDQVNKILTAVVQGMSGSEGNTDVRLAATRALYNALGFAQANFSNDMERDYIMRVVCEATLSPEVRIRQAAFECLVSISSTYYDKLAPYIQDIFNITSKAVKEDEEPVALQAVEFWSSICDEEIDILEEYGGDFSGDSDIPCFYFIKQALPALVPMLLETLLKQEEDQDQEEGAWNIAMAGGTCLGLVARTVGDDIVPLVVPFVEENIAKPDWRQREAATYAFGSILEGPSPEKLIPLVNVALSFMLSALTKDPNSHVKDTTAWTLGRIFEFLHGSATASPIITPANCQQIVTVLLQSMKDTPNVAEKACGALYFLAQGYEDVGPSSPLTPFFQEIVQSLLTVTHREDAGESRLRTAAYETLNEVVRCSTDETAPLVLQLVPVIMLELHNTLEGQKLSSDEREKQSDFQGLLCGCLQVIIQKLGSSEPTKYVFMQYADQIMGLFLRVFACRSATVHEEAMLAIGALAYTTGPDFAKYMPEFYRYLEMGLQNFEEYQVCAVTVGVVGDISRALEDKIVPYCDGIMTQLLKNLSSNQLHRSVKPPIFSCFGDIALAVGEYFEKYLMWAMSALQRAAELSTHTAGDDEMTEYTNSLRNGILEAYSGIFQGFKNSPKTQLLIPYAPHILQFLDGIYMEKDMDDVVMKTAIGVLGDLADTLGSHAGSLIQQSLSSKDFLNECLSSEDHMIKESAEWAKLAIGRAISV